MADLAGRAFFGPESVSSPGRRLRQRGDRPLVFDGRKRHHARAVAGVTAVLATMSLGFVMSPASAAPDTTQKLDAAQARVDKLSDKAETADQRHRQGGHEAREDQDAAPPDGSLTCDRHQRLIAGPARAGRGHGRRQLRRHRRVDRPRQHLVPALDAQVKKDSTTLLVQRGPRQRGRRRSRRCPGALQRPARPAAPSARRRCRASSTCSPVARRPRAAWSGRPTPARPRPRPRWPTSQAKRMQELGRTRRGLRQVEGRQRLRLRRCRTERRSTAPA